MAASKKQDTMRLIAIGVLCPFVLVLRDPGTSGAMNAAIEGAYTEQKPILFYYWGPTELSQRLDMRDLEQPAPSECPDNDPVYGCAFPSIEVKIALNTALNTEAPELVQFFKAWDWNAANQFSAEGWYSENKDALRDNGKSSEQIYSATGVWYLKNHHAWKNWMPSNVSDNVMAALAIE